MNAEMNVSVVYMGTQYMLYMIHTQSVSRIHKYTHHTYTNNTNMVTI